MSVRSRSGRGGGGLAVGVVLAAGLALSLLLAFRTQVGGDQLNLLARGWLLVERGEWVPYGNPASTGGAVPGGLTALLVGGPLALWSDHRAPVLGLLLTQLAAFLLLDRFAAAALGPRARVLFAILYWLNPWRLLISSFLWNPGYLLLVGAIHLWSCWKQRVTPSFGASFALALAIGLGIQVHPGALLLGVASLGLLAAGCVRLRWSGLVTGGLVAALPLIPWFLAIDDQPEKLPISEGFLGRGLLLLFPVRGASYWFRYLSFHLPNKETRFDFTPDLDSVLAPVLRVVGDVLVKGIGPVTVLLALAASVWLWRPLRRHGWRRLLHGVPGAARGVPVAARGGEGGGRRWTLAYLRVTFLASLLLYALAPTTVMWWQPLPVLHAAVLTVTLAAGVLARRRPGLVRAGVVAWSALAVTFALLLAFGGPRHRCGGRSNMVIPLRHDHPMLHDLGIHRSCRVPIESWGWWPDVLPEPQPSSSPSL